jgi:hypothetical protein
MRRTMLKVVPLWAVPDFASWTQYRHVLAALLGIRQQLLYIRIERK